MFLTSLNRKQKETFICLAHNVVVSDGDLSAGEEAMMEEMRREMNLDHSVVSHYVGLEGIADIYPGRRARAIVMLSLIRLGYADGAFEIEEQCFLKDLAAAFEITDSDFALIDNWVKRLVALEREANVFM